MKFLNKSFFILLGVLSVFHMKGQDSIPPKTINISGYADMYYNIGFNNPGVGAKLWGPAAGSRAFDINNNQFSLGMIQGKVQYIKDKIELVADMIAGPNTSLATLAQFTGSSFPLSLGGGVFGIKQLYGVYKPTDKLSFTLGQFGTHIGYEVIESSINFHYSLSNLFNNGPFFHTGIKVNYAISDKIGIMAGLVNAWDTYDDNNAFKSPIAQVSILPVEGLFIYLNFLTGKGDRAGSLHPVFNDLPDPDGFNTTIYDITAGYTMGKLTLGLNGAYGVFKATENSVDTEFKKITKGETDNPNFGGVAGYLSIAATDKVALGARVEQYSDYYGVRYLGGQNTSVTFTTSFSLAGGSFLLKPELRFDSSKGDNNVNGHADLYLGKDGTTQDNQTTLGLSAIFKF